MNCLMEMDRLKNTGSELKFFSGRLSVIKFGKFFSFQMKYFVLSFGSFHLISEILISSGLMEVVRFLYIFSKGIKFAIIPSIP